MSSVLDGPRIRLTALDANSSSADFARWQTDSVYLRHLADDPALPATAPQMSASMEKLSEHALAEFAIRAHVDDKLIGFIALFRLNAPEHQHAWLAIGIGDDEFRGSGYGTEALERAIHFAFEDLGLLRLTLSVFEYNERARHVYQKLGFVLEGRVRESLIRDGRRWDLLIMGLLANQIGQKSVK